MIRIITDSASSISKELAEELDIEIASLFVRYDGEEHLEIEMDIDGFYDGIEERIDDIPTSSQPSLFSLQGFFEKAAQAGDEVLGIFISSKLSGTYESAIRAARVVQSNNIGFSCVLIDSASAGYDEAFAVFDAVEARNSGADLIGCAAAAENAIFSSRIVFVPDSLAFLKAGGRIGQLSSLLGSMIQILPIITVIDGTPNTLAKARTNKKALNSMVDTLEKDIELHGLKRLCIHYIGKKTKELSAFKDKIESIVGHEVNVIPVSPVIGSHVGPAIGFAYECLSNIEKKLSNDSNNLVFALSSN